MTLEQALELDLLQRMEDFAAATSDEERFRIVGDFKRLFAQYKSVRAPVARPPQVEGWVIQ